MTDVLKYSIPLPIRHALITRGRHSLKLTLEPVAQSVTRGVVVTIAGVIGLPFASLLLVIPLMAIQDLMRPGIGVALMFLPMVLAAAIFLWLRERLRGEATILHANRYRLLVSTGSARSRRARLLVRREDIASLDAGSKAALLELQLRDGTLRSVTVCRSSSEIQWIAIHLRAVLGLILGEPTPASM
jgi:hypothetical protein